MRTYIAVVVLATLAGVTAARAQTVAETVVGDQSTLILSAIDGAVTHCLEALLLLLNPLNQS